MESLQDSLETISTGNDIYDVSNAHAKLGRFAAEGNQEAISALKKSIRENKQRSLHWGIQNGIAKAVTDSLPNLLIDAKDFVSHCDVIVLRNWGIFLRDAANNKVQSHMAILDIAFQIMKRYEIEVNEAKKIQTIHERHYDGLRELVIEVEECLRGKEKAHR